MKIVYNAETVDAQTKKVITIEKTIDVTLNVTYSNLVIIAYNKSITYWSPLTGFDHVRNLPTLEKDFVLKLAFACARYLDTPKLHLQAKKFVNEVDNKTYYALKLNETEDNVHLLVLTPGNETFKVVAPAEEWAKYESVVLKVNEP